ncbi:MAG: acetate--CoA ligase family protein, partial [Chloroflexi bacterium]|nr:acetate--CoA ligase family protein [Chloroflexota bacterium]
MEIIREALARGQAALNEYDSKLVCSALGIPVCREVTAGDVESAAAEAAKIGFPVVLKTVGEKLLHKTEAGAIALNLTDAGAVRREGRRLLKIKGSQALLVQEMVGGARELVCGLTRDDQFGPCVMFGLGGILTEVFRDVVFRVAPLTEWDAREMISEIRHQKILETFRGEKAVDRDQLVQILVALGNMARQYPAVESVDINPLKIRPDGRPVAVDALVILSPGKRPDAAPADKPTKQEDLRRFFEPESVAVIGASATPGKAGNTVVRNILANGYTGKLYLVNPKGGEIEGIPVHSSIGSLPEGVAQAIIMTPARTTVQAVRDCAARGIRYIVLAAGGFSEVDEEGEELQRELTRAIAETGVRAIGPNTSGHISTPHRFTSGFFPLGKIPRGNISYIAQTGNFATHTMRYITTGENFGVARVVGLGNKIDIDESEVLEYYADDPETKAIFMYLEGIKRPRRFLEIAGEVTRIKPVFMLKGGSTGEGSRAAMTHTAALASDERIIDGAIAQAGITRLYDYSHLFLVAKALSVMPLP